MNIYEELQARTLIAQVTDEEEIRKLVRLLPPGRVVIRMKDGFVLPEDL